jgi:OmpA-OmpF porin, OOP family
MQLVAYLLVHKKAVKSLHKPLLSIKSIKEHSMTTQQVVLMSSLAAILTASTATLADSRGTTPGYASDSAGDIVRSGSGDCVHTGSWSKQDATISGCDGYVANTAVEIIKGEAQDAISTYIFPQAELFSFDSDKLSEPGKAYIKHYREQLGDALAQAYAIILIGYTDSTGNEQYNQGLSKRRADAVAAYLETLGVSTDKVKTVGRGENDPIAPNDSDANRAQNRRVEVVVVGQPRALDTMVFPSVALFERRSADITADGKLLLEKSIVKAHDELKRAVFIGIVGHTDDVGDDAYNQDLSEKRAMAVRNYLVGGGADADKIATWGMGEKDPIASNATAEGRAENRRVEVLVLGRIKR